MFKRSQICLEIFFFAQFWYFGDFCSSKIIKVFTPDRSPPNQQDIEDTKEMTTIKTDFFDNDQEFDILEVDDENDKLLLGVKPNCLGASCSSREFRPPPGRPEMPLPRPWTTEIPEEPDREDWISPRFPIPGLGGILGGGNKPHCIMYGTCDMLVNMVNCPSNGTPATLLPKPVLDPTDQLIHLPLLCPHLVAIPPKVCCSKMQMMVQNTKFLATWSAKAVSCMPCAQNLVKLFCELNCAPDQSLHGYVQETGRDSVTFQSTAEIVRYYVTEEYAQEVFDSCKDASGIDGKPLVSTMCHDYKNKKCTANRFFEGIGMSNSIFSPLKVSFGIRRKDQNFNVTFQESGGEKNMTFWPLNTTSLPVASCEEGNLLGIPPAPACSCENCKKACPKTTTTRRTITFGNPKLPNPRQFLPQNVPKDGFWVKTFNLFKDRLWLLYSIQAGAITVTFMALMCFACYSMKHLHAATCERARKRIARIRYREATNRYRFWEFHRMYMQKKAVDEYAKRLKRYRQVYNENNYNFNDCPGYNSDFGGYGDYWRLGIDLVGQRVWLQNTSIDVTALREENMFQTLEAEDGNKKRNGRYRMKEGAVEVHNESRNQEQVRR